MNDFTCFKVSNEKLQLKKCENCDGYFKIKLIIFLFPCILKNVYHVEIKVLCFAYSYACHLDWPINILKNICFTNF